MSNFESHSDADGQAPKKSAPRWETIVMALSFVAIWVWWLARQNAYRTQTDFSPLWNVGLGILVALLIWIFVRRLQRTLGAIRELNQR